MLLVKHGRSGMDHRAKTDEVGEASDEACARRRGAGERPARSWARRSSSSASCCRPAPTCCPRPTSRPCRACRTTSSRSPSTRSRRIVELGARRAAVEGVRELRSTPARLGVARAGAPRRVARRPARRGEGAAPGHPRRRSSTTWTRSRRSPSSPTPTPRPGAASGSPTWSRSSGARLLAELDYRQEAANLDAPSARSWRTHDRIVVPQPIADYTTGVVLTMEYVAGPEASAASAARARWSSTAPALADELFGAYLDQILVDGFFHADPHPGNVLVTDDGRLGAARPRHGGAASRRRCRTTLIKLLLAISEGDGDGRGGRRRRARRAARRLRRRRVPPTVGGAGQPQPGRRPWATSRRARSSASSAGRRRLRAAAAAPS